MPTNKHATIRYNALDKCFRNIGRKYYIETLIETCNNALFEYSGIEDGVKRRQVFDDITFMESEAGWGIELDRIRDGRRIYYRYSEPSFSISNKPLNETEVAQLRETISTLSRFKGLPQFEWMEEIMTHLENSISLIGIKQAVVGFESNPYLKGLENFPVIFNAIINKQVLSIKYKGFKNTEPINFEIHPYYLKQYNNRWYLLGINNGYDNITNLPLDRIESVGTDNSIQYQENSNIDFAEYFEDVVGVSIPKDSPIENVVLKINKELFPYIETKPLHGSQTKIGEDDNTVTMKIQVYLNYELKKLLLSFGDGIEIISPQYLRGEIQQIAKNIVEKYNCAG